MQVDAASRLIPAGDYLRSNWWKIEWKPTGSGIRAEEVGLGSDVFTNCYEVPLIQMIAWNGESYLPAECSFMRSSETDFLLLVKLLVS